MLTPAPVARHVRPIWLAAALAACGARTELGVDGSGAGGGSAELCNGLDDDGDGQIDEGLGELTCGVGACARSVPACVNGVVGQCVAGAPTEEVCNGLDDDCDGGVDEALPLVVRSGPFVVDPSLWYLAISQIVPSDDGLMVLYQTSFNGSEPEPNLRLARLDGLGQPLADPVVASTRNVPNGPLLAAAPGGWLMTACGRYGSEDRAMSGILSPDGTLTEHGMREPAGHFCGAGFPGGVWSGDRYLVAWTDNSTMDVRLDRADATGHSLSTQVLSPDGDLYSQPRFAVTSEGSLLTYSVVRDGKFLLRVHRLDRQGALVGEPLELPSPVEGDQWLEAQLATGNDGEILLVARGSLGAWYRARFSASGELVDGPVAESVPELRVSQHALAAHPGGGFVLAGNVYGSDDYGFVSLLDASGQETATWSTLGDPIGEPILGWPSVTVRDGLVFVAYVSLLTPNPDFPELRVLGLGCEP